LRSLPPFPVHNLAGAVDGGKGGSEDVSGGCGNAGVLRAGVGGLPDVPPTKVRVLLRPECRGTPWRVRHYLDGVLLRLLPGFNRLCPSRLSGIYLDEASSR
jgi:hypothetical protein